MKKSITWCLILGKRQLKRPSLIAVLMCMVILAISMRIMSKDITASISVGFVTKDDTLKENLLAHEGLISFEEYSTKDDLLNAVSSSSIQCGYIFNDDFTDRFSNIIAIMEIEIEIEVNVRHVYYRFYHTTVNEILIRPRIELGVGDGFIITLAAEILDEFNGCHFRCYL